MSEVPLQLPFPPTCPPPILGRMARRQTYWVRIRTLVLVASILLGLHCPTGTEDDEFPIPCAPSLSDQGPHQGARRTALLPRRFILIG